MRARLRSALDHRTGLVVAALGFVALLTFEVINGALTTSHALDAAAAANRNSVSQRQATSHRIDQLQAQIARLQDELVDANGQRAQLLTEIQALSAQLTSLGIRPVITLAPAAIRPTPTANAPRSTFTPPPPIRSPIPSAPPTPRPTATPTPTPSPSKRVCVLVICI